MVNEDGILRPALIQKHNNLHFYLNHHFVNYMFHEQLTSLITLSCLIAFDHSLLTYISPHFYITAKVLRYEISLN